MDTNSKNNNLLLDLFSYKTNKCKKKNCNKKFRCKFYHNLKDKRRCIIKYGYYSRICENKEYCKNEKCRLSHNNFELLYHPTFYKNNYCITHLKYNNCKYKEYCCNAHNEEELRIEMIHYIKQDYNFFLFKFKTVFCPLKNFKHEKDKCVYAHNYQDFRRKPINFNQNKKCEKWPTMIPDIYTDFCKFNCKKYHGWKEYEYHYSNYKRKLCSFSYENCKYKLWCPKLHKESENNLLKIFNNAQKNLFIISPRTYSYN